jgi:hypothetical protein
MTYAARTAAQRDDRQLRHAALGGAILLLFATMWLFWAAIAEAIFALTHSG